MSRIARIIAPGRPHHVTQRGNRKGAVFLTSGDYQKYLYLMTRFCRRYEVKIWAYCLMPNHVHLILTPPGKESLFKAMRDCHTAYAGFFNWRTGNQGHVWQARFFSSVLDDDHFWTAVRYVERNPVRSGLVRAASDYAWSSAKAHCDREVEDLLSMEFPSEGIPRNWEEWLRKEDAEGASKIRLNTKKGSPSGSVPFKRGLEVELDRQILPLKRGRKPKIR